jgi:hypothetical protein
VVVEMDSWRLEVGEARATMVRCRRLDDERESCGKSAGARSRANEGGRGVQGGKDGCASDWVSPRWLPAHGERLSTADGGK